MLISELTDKELLRVFSCSCRHIAKARRNKDLKNLAHYIHDNEYIMTEVTKRLPQSYRWEIEQILRAKAKIQSIKPGNNYKHNRFSSLRIQIVDEYDFSGPLWSCRLFVAGVYVCRFIVKQSTILNHFAAI